MFKSLVILGVALAAVLLLIAARSLAREPADPADPTDELEVGRESLGAVKKLVERRKAVLVDVREKSEWDAGHVDRAIFLPMSQLESLDAKAVARRLPRNKTIYTYCAAGIRSALAAEQLAERGFKVKSLSVGYQDLVKSGFPKAPQEIAK